MFCGECAQGDCIPTRLMFWGVFWVSGGFFEASDVQSGGYQAMADFRIGFFCDGEQNAFAGQNWNCPAIHEISRGGKFFGSL